jgi:hypothetical protein
MRLILLTLVLCVFFLLGWWAFGEGLEEAWDVEVLAGRFREAKGWAWLVGASPGTTLWITAGLSLI